jgi:hypothetical protein
MERSNGAVAGSSEAAWSCAYLPPKQSEKEYRNSESGDNPPQAGDAPIWNETECVAKHRESDRRDSEADNGVALVRLSGEPIDLTRMNNAVRAVSRDRQRQQNPQTPCLRSIIRIHVVSSSHPQL